MATVLVVEDDKLSQRLLGKILSGAGHTALTTDAVQPAWEMLVRPTLVDLVILDNQLAKGWGWELLERIRGDVVFQPLPVIVYTGHTERSSILKYVELGVQGMLVKPYRANSLLAEIDKAISADWMSRLIEPPQSACERLKVQERDYYSMLSAVASSLERDIRSIREELKTRSFNDRRGDQLKRIFDQSVALGMPALKTTAEALSKAMEGRNTPETQARLHALESLQRIIRHRANAYIGVQEVLAPSGKLAPSHAPAPTPPAGAQASPFAAFVQRTTAAPLWTFGSAWGRLASGRLFQPEDWQARYVERPRPALLDDFLTGFTALRDLPFVAIDSLSDGIHASPGFEEVYLSIALRLGSLDDDNTTLDVALAIHRLGIDRTGVLLTCARIARSARVGSPLDLTPLVQHTLAVTLLAYEIAHSLRLRDEHLAAAAGLGHDLGKWILALSEPVLFGLALARSLQASEPLEQTERILFSLTDEEIGAHFLEKTVGLSLMRDAAAFHSRPENAAAENQPLVAAVFLADQLAWAATAESEDQARAVRNTLARADHPVWEALARSGIELPMDVPELLDTWAGVAGTSHWISSVLVEWAAKPPPPTKPQKR